MSRHTAWALGSALAILAVSATAREMQPRVAPSSVGLAPARLAEATALLDRFVADDRIAGAVAAVARHGSIAYLEAVGVQDLDTRAPMTAGTLFRIYSMTKPVTAVAVMMLHDEGRFRLDDPVAMYLPSLATAMVVDADGMPPRPPARAMTVADLLLHTAGLSHRTSPLYQKARVRSRDISLTQFVENVARTPLMEDPGTRFRYSESTTVLGRLVEVWSGQPFDVFLAERIFRPLGMTDTVFTVDAPRRSRLATAYAPTPKGLRATAIESLPFTERPVLLEGAVGLVSTVPDYLRFSQMLLNKGELDGVRLLQAGTVERMTGNGLPEAIQSRRGPMGWGLANVNVVIDAASPLAGEYGWDGTAGTISWVDPARAMITILMVQIVPPNPDGIRQQFKALIQRAVQ